MLRDRCNPRLPSRVAGVAGASTPRCACLSTHSPLPSYPSRVGLVPSPRRAARSFTLIWALFGSGCGPSSPPPREPGSSAVSPPLQSSKTEGIPAAVPEREDRPVGCIIRRARCVCLRAAEGLPEFARRLPASIRSNRAENEMCAHFYFSPVTLGIEKRAPPGKRSFVRRASGLRKIGAERGTRAAARGWDSSLRPAMGQLEIWRGLSGATPRRATLIRKVVARFWPKNTRTGPSAHPIVSARKHSIRGPVTRGIFWGVARPQWRLPKDGPFPQIQRRAPQCLRIYAKNRAAGSPVNGWEKRRPTDGACQRTPHAVGSYSSRRANSARIRLAICSRGNNLNLRKRDLPNRRRLDDAAVPAAVYDRSDALSDR